MPEDRWVWTAKLPLLAVGFVAILAGLLMFDGRWRFSLPVALILLGGGMVLYSSTLHSWCAPATSKFSGMAWGNGMYTAPTLGHCVRLVYPGYR